MTRVVFRKFHKLDNEVIALFPDIIANSCGECASYCHFGQHSPADIPALLAALESCDIALGSRFLRPEDMSKVPFLKRQLLRCARLVNFVFTGLWLSDAHNGFRALGPKALACINLTENRMAHATEILSQIKAHRLTWREVPTTIRYTSYSKQKGQRWYNSLNILIDLILNKIF